MLCNIHFHPVILCNVSCIRAAPLRRVIGIKTALLKYLASSVYQLD